MTDPTPASLPQANEADVAEQNVAAYDADGPTMDTDYLSDRADVDAAAVDLIDQAIEIPFGDDDDRDA